jgi:hypothetical protein
LVGIAASTLMVALLAFCAASSGSSIAAVEARAAAGAVVTNAVAAVSDAAKAVPAAVATVIPVAKVVPDGGKSSVRPALSTAGPGLPSTAKSAVVQGGAAVRRHSAAAAAPIAVAVATSVLSTSAVPAAAVEVRLPEQASVGAHATKASFQQPLRGSAVVPGYEAPVPAASALAASAGNLSCPLPFVDSAGVAACDLLGETGADAAACEMGWPLLADASVLRLDVVHADDALNPDVQYEELAVVGAGANGSVPLGSIKRVGDGALWWANGELVARAWPETAAPWAAAPWRAPADSALGVWVRVTDCRAELLAAVRQGPAGLAGAEVAAAGPGGARVTLLRLVEAPGAGAGASTVLEVRDAATGQLTGAMHGDLRSGAWVVAVERSGPLDPRVAALLVALRPEHARARAMGFLLGFAKTALLAALLVGLVLCRCGGARQRSDRRGDGSADAGAGAGASAGKVDEASEETGHGEWAGAEAAGAVPDGEIGMRGFRAAMSDFQRQDRVSRRLGEARGTGGGGEEEEEEEEEEDWRGPWALDARDAGTAGARGAGRGWREREELVGFLEARARRRAAELGGGALLARGSGPGGCALPLRPASELLADAARASGAAGGGAGAGAGAGSLRGWAARLETGLPDERVGGAGGAAAWDAARRERELARRQWAQRVSGGRAGGAGAGDVQ